MQILKTIRKVPAGLLNLPMLAVAVIHTLFPAALEIGGATTALFSTGTMTIIGMMLFVTGAQFDLADLRPTLARGFVLLVCKLVLGLVVTLAALRLLGPAGALGIPVVAIVAAVATTNAGVYLALADSYGDSVDRAAFGLLNLVSVPAVPLLFLALADGEGLDFSAVLSTLAPFLIGMLLGNLDKDIRSFLAPATTILLPFLGFCFGALIDLRDVVSAGLSGLLLTVVVVLINAPIVFVDRKILRRPGYGGSGMVPTAGAAIAVPSLYAASHAEFLPYTSAAAAQIAMAVVLTSVAIPFWAHVMSERDQRRGQSDAPDQGAVPKGG